MREEVTKFAEIMERKLQANDHKPGWKEDPHKALLARMCDEMVEVLESFEVPPGASDNFATAQHNLKMAAVNLRHAGYYSAIKPTEKTSEELADVANFCMMLADNCAQD